MKKILTILSIVAVMSFTVQAQSFELIPKDGFTLDAALNGENDFYDFKVECSFVNNTTSETDFVWEKEIISVPEEWYSTVCDPKGCYGPEHTTAAFNVPTNSTASNGVYVGFIPAGVAGTAKLNLKIYPVDKPQLAKNYSFTVNVSNTLNIKDKNSIMSFTMYPNPCVENITVPSSVFSKTNGVGNIINIEGKTVKSVSLRGSSDLLLDVSDLNEGVYKLQYTSSEGTTISESFLKK